MNDTLIVAILGSGVLSALISGIVSIINNHQSKKNGIEKSIQTLSDKVDKLASIGDERNAVAMRVRILRFRDEMLQDKGHTHDSFQQVLSDIDEYEKYCTNHPDFKNNQTMATIDHIKRNYQERLEKHDFL